MTGSNVRKKESREPLALSVQYGIPILESHPLTGRVRPDGDTCTIIDNMNVAGPQAKELGRRIY